MFRKPRLELALPRPFESTGLSVPWWGPRRLLSERGQACVAPGLHQGGVLAAETALSEVKTAPVHLRVPVGSRRPHRPHLLLVTPSLLLWEVGGGGLCAPGASPGSPPEPCTQKLALLICPAEWGRNEEITVLTSPRACPVISEGSGLLSRVPGRILAPLAFSRRSSRPPASHGHLPGWQTAQGLGEASSVRLGAVPHDPGTPHDGWCGLPTCLAWLLLHGTSPTCD